jgi:major vault protein
VVFPTPTQKFFTKDDKRRFRAYELQPTNGIHVKVIADYTDDGKSHKAGDELFITGADMPIYYPREEHAIISYGDSDKTYAVAIPSGEGRYVLSRSTGEIRLITGPEMFLPNPIEQVIVRRILSQSECELYYPGNRQAQQFNQSLRAEGADDASSDFALMEQTLGGTASAHAATRGLYSSVATTSASASPARATFADQLSRNTQYTPPRMLTLDSKFDGAVRIDVWSGFAVQVVNSNGDRRAVLGPTTVLLEYDEYLERLVLSTGTPKKDATRITTPYLEHGSAARPLSSRRAGFDTRAGL